MMKWMTIGAGSTIGGMVGWNIGHSFFTPTTSVWLSFFLSMAGTWAGWKLAQSLE